MNKFILIFGCLLLLIFITGCTSDQITGEAIKNLTLSPDAYLEIDGKIVEIPFNTTKINESYYYKLTNLSEYVGLNNITNLKVLDRGEVVFEYSPGLKEAGFAYKSVIEAKNN
jgi:hypothetical protein